MKAIYRAQYGEAEQLVSKDLAKPKLAPDKFLIEVFYNTINRTDCGILSGKPFVFRLFIGLLRPRSAVLGSDFVGRVIETGDQIKRFQVGDLVWGLSDEGLASQAEMVLLSESNSVLPLAPGLDPREAVACAEGGHYAINFLNKIKLEAKAKVLVNGATGAIGIMLLQLLKSEGAYVCAVGNGKNQGLLEELGADKFWDYEKVNFTEVETEQYDFIFDAVGKSRFNLCKPLLKKSGVYISSELGQVRKISYSQFQRA